MNKTQKHNVEKKQQDTKEYIQCDSICTEFKKTTGEN